MNERSHDGKSRRRGVKALSSGGITKRAKLNNPSIAASNHLVNNDDEFPRWLEEPRVYERQEIWIEGEEPTHRRFRDQTDELPALPPGYVYEGPLDRIVTSKGAKVIGGPAYIQALYMDDDNRTTVEFCFRDYDRKWQTLCFDQHKFLTGPPRELRARANVWPGKWRQFAFDLIAFHKRQKREAGEKTAQPLPDNMRALK